MRTFRRERFLIARLFEEITTPKQIVVVAQAAWARFDIWFLQKNGRAVFEVSHPLIVPPPSQEIALVAAQADLFKAPLKLREQRFASCQEPRFQQGGLGNVVVVGVVARFPDGARCVADLEPDVPEDVQNLFDQVVDVVGHLVRRAVVQKQNVHVAVGIEFAAPVAADGHHRGSGVGPFTVGMAIVAGIGKHVA